MASLPERLQLMRWLMPRTRLAAMAETLRVANPAERGVLVDAVAEQAGRARGEDAIRILIEHAGAEQDAGVRHRVLEHLRGVERSRVEQGLGGLLDQGDPHVRAAAAKVVGALPCHTLAGRLVPMLSVSDEECVDAAEAALRGLAAWLIDSRLAGRAISPGHVGAAMLAAIEHVHEHRRASVVIDLMHVLQAGMRFEQPVRLGETPQRKPALAWLHDGEHPALLAIRRALRAGGDPASRAAAWVWLKHPVVAAACAERLSAACPPGDLEWVFARTHLAANPTRASELVRLVGERGSVPTAIVPDAATVAAMSYRGRAGFAAWIGVLPVPTRLKDAALGGLLSDPEPAVRHAALRAAVRLESRPACMLDLCFDTDARVARSAALAVACQPERGMVRDALREHTLTALVRSPHVTVARIAVGTGACDPLANVDSPAARLRLRRELEEEPGRVLTRLNAAIGGADDTAATAGVTLARRLRRVRDVQPTIMRAIPGGLGAEGPASPRRLAVLASALGDLDDAESGLMLDRCLTAGDARVRANAADAVARRSRRAGRMPAPQTERLLLGLCADEAHRPRASAARALLATTVKPMPRCTSSRDAGEQTLLAMLEDQRSMHRVAGLWLAERAASRVAPLPEIVDAVAAIAKAAIGEDERTRARRTAERLIVEIRTGWTLRAQPMVEMAAEEAAA